MAYSTEVKYFRSDMPGMPSLSAASYGYVDLLHSILINPLPWREVQLAEVVSGKARFTMNDGEGAGLYSVVEIKGISNEPNINGEHRVIDTGIDWFEIEISSGVPNAVLTSTGIIEARYATVAWEEIDYNGTTALLMRSSDPTSNGFRYNLYSSGYTICYQHVDKHASSVLTTPTGQVGALGGVRGGYSNIPYAIITTSRYFYLLLPYNDLGKDNFNDTYKLNFFGDCISDLPPQYGSYKPTVSLNFATSTPYDSSLYPYNLGNRSPSETISTTNYGVYLANSLFNNSGVYTALVLNKRDSNTYFSGRSRTPLPDWRNGQLTLLPYLIPDNGYIIGRIPGLYFIDNDVGSTILNFTIIENDGHLLLASYSAAAGSTTPVVNPHNTTTFGPVLIDITGPIG